MMVVALILGGVTAIYVVSRFPYFIDCFLGEGKKKFKLGGLDYVMISFILLLFLVGLLEASLKSVVNQNQERERGSSEKRIEKIEPEELPFIQVKYCDNNGRCIIKKEKDEKHDSINCKRPQIKIFDKRL